MRHTMSVIDLFAGAGGFTLGFIKNNETNNRFYFNVVLLADIDQAAVFTFKKNYPSIPYWNTDLSQTNGNDICKIADIKPGKLDFLIGGPPCQGFSPNGKRWLEDNRNLLMHRYIEIALQIQPKCIIIENVPAALSAMQKMLNSEIQEALSNYFVKTSILNASAYGVPQIRKRAFIVAFRSDLGIKQFNFPKGIFDSINNSNIINEKEKINIKYISVEDAIGDLPSIIAGQSIDGLIYDSNPFSKYQKERRIGSIGIFNHVARAHSREFLSKISIFKPGQGNNDLANDQKLSSSYFSQAYARLHPKGIGFTITANFRNPGSGRFTHYRDNRSITVREAARLQSFDDRYIFHGYDSDQERHVGNAVPPILAKALAHHFGNILIDAN